MQIEVFYSDGQWTSPLGTASVPNDVKLKDIKAAVKDLGLNDQVEVKLIKAKRGSISGRQHSDSIILDITISTREEAVPIAAEIMQELSSRG